MGRFKMPSDGCISYVFIIYSDVPGEVRFSESVNVLPILILNPMLVPLVNIVETNA